MTTMTSRRNAPTTPTTSTPYTTIRACYCQECVDLLPNMETVHHASLDEARRYGLGLARDGHRVELYRGHIGRGVHERLVATISRTSEWCDVPRDYRGPVLIARLLREDLRALRRTGVLDIPAGVRLSVRVDRTMLQGGVVVEMTNPDGWANGAGRHEINDRIRLVGRMIAETFRAHDDGYTWLEALVDTRYVCSIAPKRH